MGILLYFAMCLSCVCAIYAEMRCPQWNANSPCICLEEKDSLIVQCTGPAPSYDVVSSLEDMLRTSVPWDLTLESLSMEELPPAIKMVSSLRLSNCHIERLLRLTPVAWPRLNEVVLESVTLGLNPWSQLKGARALKSVKVSDVSMMRIVGQNFRMLPDSVEYLDIRKTGTTRLDGGCMSHLKNLRYVFIADMPLSEFPRDVLPVLLPQLHTFILGNTLIERLEENFFDGMPKLSVLMLNGNKLTSLDSQLFMPLRNHLIHLVAERNPLQCKCDLLWLRRNFQGKETTRVMATCYDEVMQEYREVMKLNEEEYCM